MKTMLVKAGLPACFSFTLNTGIKQQRLLRNMLLPLIYLGLLINVNAQAINEGFEESQWATTLMQVRL